MSEHTPGWYLAPDRPGQHRYHDGTGWTDTYAPAPGTPAPKSGGGKKILIPVLACLALAVVGLGIGLAAGSGDDETADTTTSTPATAPAEPGEETPTTAATNSGNTDNPPQDDVTLEECTMEQFVGPKATGVIENHSSERSNYSVQVSFEDPDGVKVADGAAFANNVDPGQRANWEAVGFAEIAEGVEISCRVVQVDRFAS